MSQENKVLQTKRIPNKPIMLSWCNHNGLRNRSAFASSLPIRLKDLTFKAQSLADYAPQNKRLFRGPLRTNGSPSSLNKTKK